MASQSNEVKDRITYGVVHVVLKGDHETQLSAAVIHPAFWGTIPGMKYSTVQIHAPEQMRVDPEEELDISPLWAQCARKLWSDVFEKAGLTDHWLEIYSLDKYMGERQKQSVFYRRPTLQLATRYCGLETALNWEGFYAQKLQEIRQALDSPNVQDREGKQSLEEQLRGLTAWQERKEQGFVHSQHHPLFG
ncbi:Uu.00g100420.m01.CDS01 [Anthostomella pinea]|uniref:Uu.00g100420.m01.CDS01 n=1 Tax=Anthostomella pinea TaxID=933095 RepID=A0AAI8VDN3_9PEZI|nr:Uu.00g100420.m01.CDS01 [Anthostomella pinea]